MSQSKMSVEELLDVTNKISSFYSSINDITDYYLKKKLDKLQQKEFKDIKDIIFSDVDIDPMDLDISIEVMDSSDFNNLSQQIATFTIENQIGRQMTIGVKENKTNKYLGFLRISSPVSSINPRNEMFGKSLRLDTINKHFYNGQTIVPVQPFGYNYLGGKLIALICTTNEVRELFNEKYNTDVCMFETTSLYGNSKGSSMYDGLEPYIRFNGLTQSKNTLSPTDEIYNYVRDIVRKYYGNSEWEGRLVNPKGSSPKSRELSKMLQIIKQELKEHDLELYKDFNTVLKDKSMTLQQKRYYTSTMGFSNVIEHINDSTPLLRTNPEKYDLVSVVNYWKNKSHKRWKKLKEENRLETKLQYYTRDNIIDGINFDIIR